MIEIPNYFKYYLRKDPAYRDCSLIAISAINTVWILKIDFTKLNEMDLLGKICSKEFMTSEQAV